MTAFAAAIFDMDGLMLDTERAAKEGWRAVLAELAPGVDADAIYEEMLGRTVPGAQRRIQELLGSDFPVEMAFAREEQAIRAFLDKGENLTRPGLEGLLEAVDRWGLAKAVATSTARENALYSLKQAGLRDRFDRMAFGDEVKNGKPAPDLFLLAAGRLGIPPEKCVVLEDSPAGVQAGRAAGMFVIQVPDLDRRPLGEEDDMVYVCPSLVEAQAYLGQLLTRGER